MISLQRVCSRLGAAARPLCARHVSSGESFKASDLEIELLPEDKRRPKPDPDTLKFGQEFSDHMIDIDWTADKGWHKPKIHPIRNYSIHPAAKVFHYAIELFEGMKAYRGIDNKVRLFRPEHNAQRMKNSARRSTLPDFDSDEFLAVLRKLVSIDQEWVPYSTTSTLYIRPTMIGIEPSLGVSISNHSKLFVITGPVGPYYPTGFKPVSLLADPQYVRAWEGGCGNFKMGSNYAPTIQIQIEALEKHNCQQVLWLYGKDHMITEVGTMNIFMFWENEQGETELLTPPLETGIILPGVTRRSLLDLARGWDEFKVTERNFTMKEVVKAQKENRLKELFGAGTACVVCPIESIVYEGDKMHIPTMDAGAPLTHRMYKELTDIQYGRTPCNWAVEIE